MQRLFPEHGKVSRAFKGLKTFRIRRLRFGACGLLRGPPENSLLANHVQGRSLTAKNAAFGGAGNRIEITETFVGGDDCLRILLTICPLHLLAPSFLRLYLRYLPSWYHKHWKASKSGQHAASTYSGQRRSISAQGRCHTICHNNNLGLAIYLATCHGRVRQSVEQRWQPSSASAAPQIVLFWWAIRA